MYSERINIYIGKHKAYETCHNVDAVQMLELAQLILIPINLNEYLFTFSSKHMLPTPN